MSWKGVTREKKKCKLTTLRFPRAANLALVIDVEVVVQEFADLRPHDLDGPLAHVVGETRAEDGEVGFEDAAVVELEAALGESGQMGVVFDLDL